MVWIGHNTFFAESLFLDRLMQKTAFSDEIFLLRKNFD